MMHVLIEVLAVIGLIVMGRMGFVLLHQLWEDSRPDPLPYRLDSFYKRGPRS